MRALLDACVLYPTVMRQMLIGAAESGAYQPQWSARIEEEWARASARNGPRDEALTRGEIVRLNVRFPRARLRPPLELERRLWLPDPDDIHVLAAAIAGSADAIVTSNAKDFPRHLLAEEGLDRLDPDQFLLRMVETGPERMADVGARVLDAARRLSGEDWTWRRLMKRARLPKVGKRLEPLVDPGPR